MEISLLISGNLTGFGRFYTSQAARDLLGNEKVDLDHHNHLTFLGNEEKAYSISFVPRYMIISQYSHILDSFRRPGKLVISLLIPQGFMMVRQYARESSEGVVYELLNKICDTFFQKNFQDGMINQNPAVLAQDYYSSILLDYDLIPSSSLWPKPMMSAAPSAVKKVGYVKTEERDVSLYLDIPYRQSYDGYNIVFFAPNVPERGLNNIDESPRYEPLYWVKIRNNGKTLPNRVKLSHPLYQYPPQRGEKAFEIKGTYQQAKDGLVPRVTVTIDSDDSIVVYYDFEKEKRTIRFVCVDISSSSPVSFDAVLPSIMMADSTRLPLREQFTFNGNEIYSCRQLVAEGSDYAIAQGRDRLNETSFSNLRDGDTYKIYVHGVFSIVADFGFPYNESKTITFINQKNGGRRMFEVTDSKRITLEGKVDDWNFSFESEHYTAPLQSIVLVNGAWQISEVKKKDVSSKAISVSHGKTNTIATSQPQSREGFQVVGGDGDLYDANQDGGHGNHSRWYKYWAIISIIFIIVGGIIFYKPIMNFFNKNVDIAGSFGGGNSNADSNYCYLMYHDATADITKVDTLQVQDTTKVSYYANYEFSLWKIGDENDTITLEKGKDYTWEQPDKYGKFLMHKLSMSNLPDEKDQLFIRVSYISSINHDTIRLVDECISNKNLKQADTLKVNLKVLMSQLKSYEELSGMLQTKTPHNYKKNRNSYRNIANDIFQLAPKASEFYDKYYKILTELDYYSSTQPSPEENPDKDIRNDELKKGDSWLTIDTLGRWLNMDSYNEAEKNRMKAMIRVLEEFKNHQEVKDIQGLSIAQKNTINQYNQYRTKLNRKKLESFGQVSGECALIIKKSGTPGGQKGSKKTPGTQDGGLVDTKTEQL